MTKDNKSTSTKTELTVEVGDVIHYIDLANPEDILTIQITNTKDDLDNGIVNESRPIAKSLLGLAVGDQKRLHLVGKLSKILQIKEIKRSAV
ncbi:MAG: GreA/GreB family elongation factor [Neisseriales bacterium]|nr:MAG: GreA/GreB family elongation factor [Neisseriales bacterium]